jgi:hypothetical protein
MPELYFCWHARNFNLCLGVLILDFVPSLSYQMTWVQFSNIALIWHNLVFMRFKHSAWTSSLIWLRSLNLGGSADAALRDAEKTG